MKCPTKSGPADHFNLPPGSLLCTLLPLCVLLLVVRELFVLISNQTQVLTVSHQLPFSSPRLETGSFCFRSFTSPAHSPRLPFARACSVITFYFHLPARNPWGAQAACGDFAFHGVLLHFPRIKMPQLMPGSSLIRQFHNDRPHYMQRLYYAKQ